MNRPAAAAATAIVSDISLLLTLLVAVSGVCVAAQDEPRFTVASIKPSVDNEPGMAFHAAPKGAYSATKITVLALLTAAFGVSPDRVIGAPPQTQRYDVDARYEPADRSGPVPPVNVLLRSLLRDRFGLVSHVEQREFPVYVLRPVTDDHFGPGLTRSRIDCADAAAAAAARNARTTAPNGAPACDAIEEPDMFIASGTALGTLARALRIPSGRTVIDGTGLTGTWDVKLEFAPLRDAAGDKPNVFTALQEQLGLRLEPSRAPLDVLVVDSIHEPTPN